MVLCYFVMVSVMHKYCFVVFVCWIFVITDFEGFLVISNWILCL